jgi:hypothetical protein
VTEQEKSEGVGKYSRRDKVINDGKRRGGR